MHGGAHTDLAFHGDLATVRMHHILDDFGSQAGAAWLAADCP